MKFDKVERNTQTENCVIEDETTKWNEVSQKINELEQMMKKLCNCSTGKNLNEDQKVVVESNVIEYNMIGTAFRVDNVQAQISISKNLDRFGRIQLLPKNIAEGKLENGEILSLTCDSGSSISFISMKTVEESTCYPNYITLKYLNFQCILEMMK